METTFRVYGRNKITTTLLEEEEAWADQGKMVFT
jgi:hypothetical protein